MRFTDYFKIDKSQFEIDFVNIDLDNDTRLFIDPWLIKLDKSDFAHECRYALQSFFQLIIENIRSDKRVEALELLNFLHEPNETRLGFSKKGSWGLAIGREHSEEIFNALSESAAVKSGFLKDIEDTTLLIEGIDKDKISDLVTNIIRKHLIRYTKEQCLLFDIPIQTVNSGFYWNSENHEWMTSDTELPLYKGSRVLLVPKKIVSVSLSITAKDFYDKEFVAFQQNYHLDARTGLCRVLKNKEVKAPYKKDIKKENPYSKDFIYNFIKGHPLVLENYKNKKISFKSILSDKQIVEVSKEISNSVVIAKKLEEELLTIKSGQEDANKYHNLIIGALTFIFSGQLNEPVKEYKINNGRKRIDISMFNGASSGFFLDCTKLNIPCRKIYFECKNYEDDPKNPEIDQLGGRFNINETKIGFLVCRNILNRKLFVTRCQDFVRQQRNFVIGLDDTDIINLLRLKAAGREQEINKFLHEKIGEINQI